MKPPRPTLFKKRLLSSLTLAATLLAMASPKLRAAETPQIALTLAPSKENPRNSEGDFVTLKDGRILFIYTHFTGGGRDNSPAFLASRISSDGGKTWSNKDKLEMENDGKENIMSVSLLRLQDGRIALFYCRKNSITDLRPIIRFSTDEGESWSAATEIIGENEIGYYVVNNDRLVQLADGRLIFPTAQHNSPSLKKFNGNGTIHCYISDDKAQTWHRSKTSQDGSQANGKQTMLQEPGLVELKDGRLMMWTRTNGGSQFVCYSKDRGESWSDFEASSLLSPVSPASIERLPKTKDLVAVWNDHSKIPKELRGKRTPLSIALSKDDGKTWLPAKTLYDLPTGWYCYTAIEFTDSDILLGHCAGDTSKGGGLNITKITRVPITWLSAK
ncbi:MAG: sialidase family protein [Verrucomicrobiota bacterium]